MPVVEIAISLLQSIGLMAFLSVVFGVLLRSWLVGFRRSVVTGILFGGGAILSMLAPIEYAPGMIMDGRAVFVGLGAAFGGLPAAIISAAMGMAFRFFLGGAGTLAGVLGIAMAAALGLLWATVCARSGRPKLRHLVVAGAMISCHFLAIYVVPLEIANRLMVNVFPMLVLSSIMSASVLGMLVERERRQIETEEMLKHAAEIDYLTGLPNRRYFHTQALGKEGWSKADPHSHTIVVFDLDHFKQVNDKWGHDAGDRALVAFADTLRRNSRSEDVVARHGGEEFVILMKQTRLGNAERAVERILSETRALVIEAADGRFSLTVSAGMIEFDPREQTLDAAMNQADQALYRAKQAGRDQLKTSTFQHAA